MLGICQYGSDCYRKNPAHLRNYEHPHLDYLLKKYRDKIGISDYKLPESDLLLYGISLDESIVKLQLEIMKQSQNDDTQQTTARPKPSRTYEIADDALRGLTPQNIHPKPTGLSGFFSKIGFSFNNGFLKSPSTTSNDTDKPESQSIRQTLVRDWENGTKPAHSKNAANKDCTSRKISQDCHESNPTTNSFFPSASNQTTVSPYSSQKVNINESLSVRGDTSEIQHQYKPLKPAVAKKPLVSCYEITSAGDTRNQIGCPSESERYLITPKSARPDLKSSALITPSQKAKTNESIGEIQFPFAKLGNEDSRKSILKSSVVISPSPREKTNDSNGEILFSSAKLGTEDSRKPSLKSLASNNPSLRLKTNESNDEIQSTAGCRKSILKTSSSTGRTSVSSNLSCSSQDSSVSSHSHSSRSVVKQSSSNNKTQESHSRVNHVINNFKNMQLNESSLDYPRKSLVKDHSTSIVSPRSDLVTESQIKASRTITQTNTDDLTATTVDKHKPSVNDKARSVSKSRYTVKSMGPKTQISRTNNECLFQTFCTSSTLNLKSFRLSCDEMKLQSFEKRNIVVNDENFVVPASKSSADSKYLEANKRIFSGRLSRIILKQRAAYIIPDNKPQHLIKEVKFKLPDLVNLCKTDVFIEKGSSVTYTLSGKKNASKIQIAGKVFVDESSQVKEEESDIDSQSVFAKKWHKGVIVMKKESEKPFYFIKPLSQMPVGYKKDKDVFLPESNAPKYGFSLQIGDKIEFLLGTKDPGKPMAIKSRLMGLSSRSMENILEYFQSTLDNVDNKEWIAGLLSCTPFWSFVSSITFRNATADVYYFLRLMHFVIRVFHVSKSYESFCIPITKIIFASAQLNTNSSLFTFINCDNLQMKLHINDFKPHEFPNIGNILMDFFDVGIKLNASLSGRAFPFILKIGESETSNRIQMWLIDIIRNVSASNSQSTSEENWRELTLIPRAKEIKGAPLEDDTLLLPVKMNEKYNSAEEYMDTYYRLLRTECFSSIQSGIDDLCADELDHRDMNVYHSIYLGGYDITNSGFSLALQFTPIREVKNWERSSNFMFGNLLCISPSGKFEDDHIWATVVNRDLKLLSEHNTIVVQLCTEHNHLTDCQAMMLLWENGGTSVMVESPAYFHSFRPVLKSLQKFDMETFPLHKEIVECCSTGPPDYLSESTLLSPTCIFPQDFNLITKSAFIRKLKVQSSTLDKSQVRAIKHALSHRLAIVQGPPGCGKTFLGVKLTQLILSCSPAIEGPILVLTYKNHALDEFLKHTLNFLDKNDIARIGGRSKEPELDDCNLRTILSNERYDKPTFIRLCEVKDDIKLKIDEIHAEAKRLHSMTQTSPLSFLNLLSEMQLVCLLENAPLKKLKFKIGDKQYASIEWLSAVMSNVLTNFGSLKSFLTSKQPQFVPNSDEDCLNKLLRKIIATWWPNAQKMKALKELQSAYLAEIQKAKMAQNDKNDTDDSDDEDFDEELIESIQENRLSALEGYLDSKAKRTTDNLRLWLKSDNQQQFQLKDLPPNLEVNPSILTTDDLWNLSDIQRVQFISSVLKTSLEYQSPTFEELLKELDLLQSKKEEIDVEYKVNILKSKRLIGMTIVGASINHSLIQNVCPQVVIVEEAAEVLEPNLVAALSPGIQHLIMIGDHMQLRPQVDTYKLRKKYHFDTSMMERLVNNQYPFKSLQKQNRMLPEFAELLKDIYPNLENNDQIIRNNKPLTCMAKSMFFWSHSAPEKSERSYRNEEEVSRIQLFVQFLVQSGCQASDITVLGAYQGQTTQLRKTIRQTANCKDVVVNTIDMYQGDENKYVIVSLVRSNNNASKNRIGFLAELNRRCVAQSRAKCGMYFVGNAETFYSNSHWNKLIHQMQSSGCVDEKLPLQCEKHQQNSRSYIKDTVELKKIISNPALLCSLPCRNEMPCKIPEHACNKPCKPVHSHLVCKTIVKFTFPSCGHASERECHVKQNTLKCQTKVSAILPCQHSISKECCVNVSSIQCQAAVDFIYCKCGHRGTRKCYQKENEVPCKAPCSSKMDCSIHNCSKKCGSPHSHADCQELVDYVFPLCGHASSKPKKCSAPITWRCQENVICKAPCGHELVKLCSDNSPMCMHPCARKRQCGHPCANFCGENCEKRLCVLCEKNLAERIKQEKDKAEKRIKEIDQQLSRKKCNPLQIKELSKNGECSAEYQKVEDLVMKFIKPEHNWYPTVTKVEKVFNLHLERQFEECKSSMHDTFTDLKFHGTSAEGVKGITENGFRMPASPGMYGSGIYFATDSSKSAQQIYTKGSDQLLLCRVLLGNTLTVKSADSTLTLSKIREKGYDSVFAPRGTKSTKGVQNDEFIIFDPKQAYPEYIITYNASGVPDPLSFPKMQPPPNGFLKTTVPFIRHFNPKDPYQNMYRFAEGHFYRMLALKGMSPLKVKEIDIVHNTQLENNFNRKKLEFTKAGIPDNVILAFHGTDVNNIDSILKNNLQVSYAKRQAHGQGNYFSEFPDVSIGYGSGLLLCELLTGREYQGHGDYPHQYHSKLVQPDASMQNSSQMVIIRDSNQILPRYVIKLSAN